MHELFPVEDWANPFMNIENMDDEFLECELSRVTGAKELFTVVNTVYWNIQ